MTETLDGQFTYKEIKGFTGYVVGTDGSVWCCIRRGPNPVITDNWRKLKQSWAGVKVRPYLQVSLRQNGRTVNRLVHRLVLETFIGPCPEGCEVRHFPDRDRCNNFVTNLRWGTAAQNADDRGRDGNTAYGTKNGNSQLGVEAVREIRLATGYGVVTALAKKHGVSRQTIISIRDYKTWRHVL